MVFFYKNIAPLSFSLCFILSSIFHSLLSLPPFSNSLPLALSTLSSSFHCLSLCFLSRSPLSLSRSFHNLFLVLFTLSRFFSLNLVFFTLSRCLYSFQLFSLYSGIFIICFCHSIAIFLLSHSLLSLCFLSHSFPLSSLFIYDVF